MLVGDYYANEAAGPAVLLMHMNGGKRSDWEPFFMPLLDARYHILTVDLRAHGETGGSRDWPLAEGDVQTWLDWLKAQDNVESVSIVGASIGSNLALTGCAADADCVTAIALSPGLDYFGIQPEEAVINGLAERSALLVAARNDGNSPDSVQQMAENGTGEIGTRYYPGRAHGTRLFSDQGERFIAMLIHWLDEHTQTEA